jgi:hypothetical protein
VVKVHCGGTLQPVLPHFLSRSIYIRKRIFFTSIHDVKPNKSFSEFTLSVDQEGFENSLDGFATLGLGTQGLFYQLFNGVDPDDYEVIIHVENGEVIHTVNYPEALENMEE